MTPIPTTCPTSPTTPLRRRRTAGRARKIMAAAALTAAAAGGLAALAPAAEAGGYTVAYTGGDGVALRFAPLANARLSPMVVWGDGTPVTIVCQTWSPETVGPRSNHIFDDIAYSGRSAPTWIPDAYVDGTAAANVFTAGIARCGGVSSTPPPSSGAAEGAIGWMTARMGSTQYDGQCLAAVYQAYLAAGRDITAGLPYGPSHDSAYSYWTAAANRHPGDTNAPRGALLFFRSPSGGAPGHVTISLGGGQMISTWDTRTHGIHTMAISSYDPSLYLGWVGV